MQYFDLCFHPSGFVPLSSAVRFNAVQYAIQFRKRFTNLDRDKVISTIAKAVGNGHKVDLKTPSTIIIVEGLKVR